MPKVTCPFCKSDNARASEETNRFQCFRCRQSSTYDEYACNLDNPLCADPEGFIYKQWFDAYRDHPSRELHFKNIIMCLKEDIEQGLVAKDGEVHKALQAYYLELSISVNTRKTQEVFDPN